MKKRLKMAMAAAEMLYSEEEGQTMMGGDR